MKTGQEPQLIFGLLHELFKDVFYHCREEELEYHWDNDGGFLEKE